MCKLVFEVEEWRGGRGGSEGGGGGGKRGLGRRKSASPMLADNRGTGADSWPQN